MIFIVPDIKLNFQAAVKSGDSFSQSDILTDQLSKLINNKKNEVISLLQESGISITKKSTPAIAQALAEGLSKDATLRKKIAELMLSTDNEKLSGAAGDLITSIENSANNPSNQQVVTDISNSLLTLFGAGSDKKTTATTDVAQKAAAQLPAAAPGKYTATFAVLGGLLAVGLLTWVYRSYTKDGAVPGIAATGALIPLPALPLPAPPALSAVPTI